ncbi:hypothetical protein ACFQVC_06680 [Streptomyces monticola]|uniref:Uncharacterized protein n=1 Tax=Streptomyces monticola TaxID=2666263 RepID=A0ABW2JDY2_9ACTN
MRSRILGVAATTAVLVTTTSMAQAVAAPEAATAAACSWTKTLLPLPAGKAYGEVQATGQGGAAGGTRPESQTNVLPQVTSWKDGKATTYEHSNIIYMTVIDRNSAGAVVSNGSVNWFGYTSNLVYVNRDGKMEPLPQPAGYKRSKALGMAADGDITGYSYELNGDAKKKVLVRWPSDRPGEVQVVTTLPDESYVRVGDGDGSVVYTDGNGKDILRRPDGGTVELKKPEGVLYGLLPDDMSNGRVVAAGDYSGGGRVGVLWESDGTPKLLPQSVGPNFEYRINSSGMIVGYTTSLNSYEPNNDGFQVWQLGTYTGRVGAKGDIPSAVGDDGTVGGVSVKDTTNGIGYGPPAVWRCS